MAEPTPRGIQATLFDFFQDTEYFSIEEAKKLVVDHQNRDVNRESIRARIYEGIEKGLFERVGKGLYTVTRKDEQGRENTCLLINGDGRDLSMFQDNSLDAIITDHPYGLETSLKGRNRNFADYELFRYDQKDFQEKLRVLRPNCFLVEFLPEENGDNYEYLYQVKDMARKAGFEYYGKVPWVKGDFVANTGRKAKNTEDVVFFTKGRARELRPNAQKNKQYANSRTIVELNEFIPGSVTVHYTQGAGLGSSSESNTRPVMANVRLSVSKEDKERARELLDKAWDDVSLLDFEDSPLDKDNGGNYSLEELFDMPAQQYILEYLVAKELSFVDLSPGPDNVFGAGTQVIVNPTNLEGPMGAGLAKLFKEKYPDLEEPYKKSCRGRKAFGVNKYQSPDSTGKVVTDSEQPLYEGDLFLHDPSDKTAASVLCFPTKRHWKDPSDLALIEAGLKTFVQNYKQLGIKSITFPWLGCGLGGLDWEKEVKPLMKQYLGDLPDIEVYVCGDTLHEDKQEFLMSGAAGMLPTCFNYPVVSRKDKIHQAEKPVALLEQILRFITKEDELVLDQFAGSGALGEAALNTNRNSILIEKAADTYEKLCQRIAALGEIETFTPLQREVVGIAIDALEAVHDGPDAMMAFADYQNQHGMPLNKAFASISCLMYDAQTPEQELQQEALIAAATAIEEADLYKEMGPRDKENSVPITSQEPSGQPQEASLAPPVTSSPTNPSPDKKVLECSSRGDRRFSALYAKVTIRGKERSIEEFYQDAKRTSNGKKAGKGKPFDYIVCPFTGDKLPAGEASNLYKGLWITYFTKNPDLVEFAKGFDEFHDIFRSESTVNCQADVIASYVKRGDAFVEEVRRSAWYQNMASKKKAPLSQQIRGAQDRCASSVEPAGKKPVHSFVR